MSLTQNTIFLILICLCLSLKTKLRTNSKRGHLEKCNAFHWCGHGLKCIDYICLNETERENYVELEWAPLGPKCNFMHSCGNESYVCEENICKIKNSTTNNTIIDYVKENLKKFKKQFEVTNEFVNELAVNLTNEILGVNPQQLQNNTKDDEKKDNKTSN